MILEMFGELFYVYEKFCFWKGKEVKTDYIRHSHVFFNKLSNIGEMI